MKKSFFSLFAIVLFVFIVAGTASAALIEWNSGTYSQSKLGDSIGSNYDIFEIKGLTGSFNLEIGTPQKIGLNDYLFTTGFNSNIPDVNTSTFQAIRNLTINGVSNNISNDYYVNINYLDTLFMSDGSTVYWDLGSNKKLGVTPLGDIILDGPGKLFATFTLTETTPTPIPAAIWLLFSGFAGLVGFRRKVKK